MLFAYMFPPLMLALFRCPPCSAWRVLADSLWGLLVAHLAISLPLARVAAVGLSSSRCRSTWRKPQWWTAVPSSAPSSRWSCRFPPPALITVGIFSFLLSWADYVFALILIMSDDRKTLARRPWRRCWARRICAGARSSPAQPSLHLPLCS
jgi:multiple sugar transport system permease protein